MILKELKTVYIEYLLESNKWKPSKEEAKYIQAVEEDGELFPQTPRFIKALKEVTQKYCLTETRWNFYNQALDVWFKKEAT